MHAIKYIAWLIIMLYSCGRDMDRQKDIELKKILALHDLQREIHFEKQVSNFVNLLSEEHISVNRGKIAQPSIADHEERFTNYFNSVDFVKWDDVAPPIIRFSDDLSVAYTIVDKEVIVRSLDTDLLDTSYFSWVAIYKKINGEWKIDCVGSTNK